MLRTPLSSRSLRHDAGRKGAGSGPEHNEAGRKGAGSHGDAVRIRMKTVPEGPEGVCVVLMTAPAGDAESLGRHLVEEGLAACATLLPGAVSIYRWEGAIERQEECQLILKATAARVPELLERAVELHPYDVPELLVLPVVAGLPGYLDWVRSPP